MPITVIKGAEGVRVVLTAIEDITGPKVVMAAGNKQVTTLASGNELEVCGVTKETVTSGELIRVMTEGIVSGILCAEAINYGQAVQGGLGISGTVSGVTGLIRPLLSGVGAMAGKALNSGGIGSGIPLLVDLG
ncbi:hypothetical protein ES703_111782 [subsurface metagenome]